MAGRVEYLSTVARDITEQKQLCAKPCAMPIAAVMSLSQLWRNELRNPLTLIRNVVELLRSALGVRVPKPGAAIHIIERQAGIPDTLGTG